MILPLFRFGDDELTTTATHPFFALLWVENANRETLNYTIQVSLGLIWNFLRFFVS